jgi:hypothetical protein
MGIENFDSHCWISALKLFCYCTILGYLTHFIWIRHQGQRAADALDGIQSSSSPKFQCLLTMVSIFMYVTQTIQTRHFRDQVLFPLLIFIDHLKARIQWIDDRKFFVIGILEIGVWRALQGTDLAAGFLCHARREGC